MRLFAAALLALLATLACAQTTDDFGATAATLMAAEQSTVTPDASLNATQFDSFYHRFLGGEPEHEPGTEPPACTPADEVFTRYDVDADTVLNMTEFQSALLEMIVAKALPCELAEEVVEEPECDNSARSAWGWGFLATLIICLLSLVGALIWLATRTFPQLRRWLTNFMIAFAVGTLLGDAILHIMPQMWELHSHGGEADAHGAHGEEEHDKWEELKFIWPGMTILASILGFGILDYVMAAVFGHSHSAEEHVHGRATEHVDHEEKPQHSIDKSTGYLNLAAEMVHNFLDGIALGVAFSKSNTLGVSTAIAIGAHELPQELGDFALLIECGFSSGKALLLNLAVSLTSLIGLCVGVSAGSKSEEAQKYLLAVAAGGFLYIALYGMAPALKRLSQGKHRPAMLALQVVGFVLGAMLLWVIAVTESEGEC